MTLPPLPTLARITTTLRRQHGAPKAPPPRTAFQWVLWENVAYLANDDTRARAFALLKRSVGFAPEKILRARIPVLLEVTRHGIVANLFARKLQQAAQIAIDSFDGNVDKSLDDDPAKAARQLRAFPGIGEPGAEKILVAIGRAKTLPLDSNGLRVMQRVGFGSVVRSYSASYRSVKAAVPIAGVSAKKLFEAYLLLQTHGRTICKAGTPLCGACQLRTLCAYALARTARH